MNPRSEPLLWLQLIAVGAIPLELLGLLLLLAGADPGPLPALERLLAWAIGVLGPAILLWQRPADVCSLLLVQVPLRGRSESQRSLAALQSPLTIKLLLVLGAAALLPLFWWMDQNAALAAPLSPLAANPRFVGLLLACPLLALILWQWQQLIQTIGLLIGDPKRMVAVTPLSLSQLESQRLSLGLPLLLLSPFQIPEPAATQPEPEPESKPEPGHPHLNQDSPLPAEEMSEEEASERETSAMEAAAINSDASVADPVAVEPEKAAEQPESSNLDQQIP